MAALSTPTLTPQEAALAERDLKRQDAPIYAGGPPRGMSDEAFEDIAARVGSMLARGWEPAIIRRSLKISRRQYDRAMNEILAATDDRLTVFAKFKASNASHLRQLAAIRQRALAMKPPALLAAIRATLAMKEVHASSVAVGQSLGHYRSVQPEARATLDDQDARRELPGLEGSESAALIDELSDVMDEWREREEPVSQDPETGQVTIVMEPQAASDGGEAPR